MACHVCCQVTKVWTYVLAQGYVVGDRPPVPDVSIWWPPALNTASLSVYIPLSSATIHRCNSAHCCCSTTATFFSSCWSPSGQVPRRTGRRFPARSNPRPARQPGATPCFPSESHIQLCPLPPVLPPQGSWGKGKEEGGGRNTGQKSIK